MRRALCRRPRGQVVPTGLEEEEGRDARVADEHAAGDERDREAVLVLLEGGADEEHEGGLLGLGLGLWLWYRHFYETVS